MRGNKTENKTKSKPERIAKICTCKHHTSTESNHEENTGFTLVCWYEAPVEEIKTIKSPVQSQAKTERRKESNIAKNLGIKEFKIPTRKERK